MSLVVIENMSHTNGGKQLYINANVQINKGEHIALIGPNGSGKTTLLNLIASKSTPDIGKIIIHPNVKIGYLDQHLLVPNNITADEYLKEAYKDLFEKEKVIEELYAKISENYEEKLLNRALKLQEELNNSEFYDVNKKIHNIIVGLNIDKSLISKPLGSISGGQKSKIILAKLLLSNNDLLLLDEPTNFLDIDQVEWLAKFLQSYQNAFLLISHDQDFINQVANIIYAIENQSINRYAGNFDFFIENSNIRKNQYLSEYKSQKKEIEKLETYIAKNKARASTAKSARSRQKKLEKMEILPPPSKVFVPHFKFKYKKPSTTITLTVEGLEIGYDHPLIQPLNFIIKDHEKLLVLGRNGVGKTTLLKTICGVIQPLSGHVKVGDNVSIGYFRQTESFDEMTPIEYLYHVNNDLTEREVLALLSNYGIKKDLTMKKMKLLSGGEQTKVRLAVFSLEPYSMLVLDEPTNHLDDLSKKALVQAIHTFPGTVVLTTHDMTLSNSWDNRVIDFNKISY